MRGMKTSKCDMIATNADRSNGGTFRNVQHDTPRLEFITAFYSRACILCYLYCQSSACLFYFWKRSSERLMCSLARFQEKAILSSSSQPMLPTKLP